MAPSVTRMVQALACTSRVIKVLPASPIGPAAAPESLGLLLVLHVADDIGDVLVAFLLLLDECRIIQGLVFELHFLILGDLDRFALDRLLALGLGIGLLE